MGIRTTLPFFCASRSVDTPLGLAYKSSLRLHFQSPLQAYLYYYSSLFSLFCYYK